MMAAKYKTDATFMSNKCYIQLAKCEKIKKKNVNICMNAKKAVHLQTFSLVRTMQRTH